MKSIRTVDWQGTIRYHNEQGITFRENGPAIIYANGTCWWFPIATNFDENDDPHHIVQYGNDTYSRKNGAIYSDGTVWYWDHARKKRKQLDDSAEGKISFS